MMQKSDYYTHQFFLRWLVGYSLLVFAALMSWQSGALDMVLDGDLTGLSKFIVGLFLLVNFHVLYRAWDLSRERNAAKHVIQLFSSASSVKLETSRFGTSCCGAVLPESLAARHVGNLVRRLDVPDSAKEQGSAQTHLLAALDRKIRAGQKTGWLVADLMIKLGLIGTVVGFVLMLGAVAVLENFDIATMQQLLTNMTSGMRVALFTTLTGLCTGLLLGVQYHFLDAQADCLLTDIEEMAEIFVIPALQRQAAG
ncbi:MAG: MotA/TolQ/ExbB proton channel family protein [bacterium]